MAEPGSSPSNVYTVLALIAMLALVVAIGFVWYQSYKLFGSANPFNVELASAAGQVAKGLVG